jgi:hypothetical protein
MRRLTLAVTSALLMLPASALAASGSGVVLSVDSKHRTIEVVDTQHVVHAYQYRGRLPRLHAGSRISFRRSGSAVTHVKAGTRSSRTVSFLGRVVRSSTKGLVLRLADGKTLSFSSKQVRHTRVKPSQRHKRHARAAAAVRASAANVTITISGLQVGVVVLITETVDAHGNITITIAFPASSSVGGGQQASGVISEVDVDAFTLVTTDGSELRLHMSQDALANLNLQPCDNADVTYHQDAGMLIADSVNDTGSSNSADCGGDSQSQDAVGTITAVSADSVTVTTEDQGSMTFAVDSPDVTDGFVVGDVVDVSYLDNGDGTFSALDVEYIEQDSSGTVTAVSDGSLTITDDQTGQPETFVADPADGLFDGIAVGDHVDVNSHQSGGQLVVDSVEDQS